MHTEKPNKYKTHWLNYNTLVVYVVDQNNLVMFTSSFFFVNRALVDTYLELNSTLQRM